MAQDKVRVFDGLRSTWSICPTINTKDNSLIGQKVALARKIQKVCWKTDMMVDVGLFSLFKPARPAL